MCAAADVMGSTSASNLFNATRGLDKISAANDPTIDSSEAVTAGKLDLNMTGYARLVQ